MKWQYRARAQLGIAAFYDADLETARKNVGAAVAAATTAGDAGGQIRLLTIIACALVQSKMYEQAIPYIESALKIATATPDVGYLFPTKELYADALIGLKQLDSAQRVVDDGADTRPGGSTELYTRPSRWVSLPTSLLREMPAQRPWQHFSKR